MSDNVTHQPQTSGFNRKPWNNAEIAIASAAPRHHVRTMASGPPIHLYCRLTANPRMPTPTMIMMPATMLESAPPNGW